MTHDELLTKIERGEDGCIGYDDENRPSWSALRAVVELHYPYWVDSDTYNIEFCKECIVPIPCKTIQAIEKELK